MHCNALQLGCYWVEGEGGDACNRAHGDEAGSTTSPGENYPPRKTSSQYDAGGTVVRITASPSAWVRCTAALLLLLLLRCAM